MPTPGVRLLAAALCFLAAPPLALALSLKPPSEQVCPIDGTKFRSRGYVPAATHAYAEHAAFERRSGQSSTFFYGVYFDLKGTGTVLNPWPMAVCPSNGFVIYKQDFPPSELERLRRYVASPEYRALVNEHASYYLAARLRAHLGEKPADLRFMLLRATWEAKSRSQYAKYAAEALEAYKAALRRPYPDAGERIVDQLVAGELERRLGAFDAALARFRSIANRHAIERDVFRHVVAVQLHLSAARDDRDCVLLSPQFAVRDAASGRLPPFDCSDNRLPAR